MRRLFVLFCAAITAPLACGLVACSLDTGGLGPISAKPAVDSQRVDASTESILPSGMDKDAAADPGSPTGLDATAATADAGPQVEASVPDAKPLDCDRDKDGFLATACGGADCCDDDALVMPGTIEFRSMPSACGNFDYDCNAQETPEHSLKDCQATFGACAGDGFEAPTACGVSADYTRCGWFFGCTEKRISKTQRCR